MCLHLSSSLVHWSWSQEWSGDWSLEWVEKEQGGGEGASHGGKLGDPESKGQMSLGVTPNRQMRREVPDKI